ncbi:MAG: nucleotide sugar dehydrogenase [Candidatus Dormibacteraeota bacterium]|nr:nucleotide sugar dehydrogenase [Candidatus Dormibacteraeota bacterium]
MSFPGDVVIMGGCGHVGLPLGLAFADSGMRVELFDTNEDVVQMVNDSRMPFRERGADEVLARVRKTGALSATTEAASLERAENVIVVVGTPVDRYLSPDIEAVPRALGEVIERLTDGQLLVLRSTVYPGVTALVEKLVGASSRAIDVCFCPERIAEGAALDELRQLPQIVAARDARVMARAATLFCRLTEHVVELTPEEAELAKLFTNSWRYIKFAAANQLFMIANDSGLDFERIREAVTHLYPRAADMPGPGFAAGPCLFKDTVQIAAFSENMFTLGHASVMINEGLPLYVVNRLAQRFDLSEMTVGVLGMAFKGGSDDTRSSLSYKLKRLLKLRAHTVLCTDPYVTTDRELTPLDDVLARAGLLIIAAPHSDYTTLRTNTPVVDLFNILGRGVAI